jgi:hypothetical protein
MNPDHWQSLRALFLEAGRMGPAERDAFLGDACRDLPALQAEVEGLLALDASAADRAIRAAIAHVAAALLPPFEPP